MLLEICCTSIEDVEIAVKSGAHRVELCKDLTVGGLTPEENDIRVAGQLGLPVMVLIRPHANGFIYCAKDQLNILTSCERALNAGAHGLVIGGLTPQHKLDVDFLKKIRATFPQTPLTCHKAIDESVDIDHSFNNLISLGIERVLTSGGVINLAQETSQLARLQQEYGTHITLLAGGGIRASNVKSLLRSGIREIHSSARTQRTSFHHADEIEIREILAILQADDIE